MLYIDQLAAKPHRSITDFEWSKLKVKRGRDSLSRVPYEELLKRSPRAVQEPIEDAFNDSKDRAAAIRWVLRGLPVRHAIAKQRSSLRLAVNLGRKPLKLVEGVHYDTDTKRFDIERAEPSYSSGQPDSYRISEPSHFPFIVTPLTDVTLVPEGVAICILQELRATGKGSSEVAKNLRGLLV